MLVAGLIGKQGLDMGAAALRELSDEAADADTVEALRQALEEAAPGEIRRLQRLRTRVMGHYIAAEAVLSVRPNATLTEADMVRRMAAAAVKRACPRVLDLSLSIVPQHTTAAATAAELDPDAGAATEPDSRRAEDDHTHGPSRLPRVIGRDVQRRVLRGIAAVSRVTHMRLHFAPDGATCVAEFEIDVMDPIMRVQDVWELASKARMLAEQVPEVTEADVHLELRDNLALPDDGSTRAQ
jgi:divalent metal cation (Fe/Co/Zn/Cd) transporter